ncbi:helix-turn-helix domain-containing protein [Mesorhizobium sp. YIM 152430]|uniref:helix-turn-helix domain-containing protein n=1 Tax=Mesorhizobium sp. YIM 152430 TaxID=3031761 RepID=UPI0023DCD6BA|nr:helix-turn-helix domain-containing protein [Mesorhizobium sp. YIM 152430]MDF1599704.1 helix-turn-helix domain-containing protein [Mesorhizobium sp. YIM 152430]
MTPRDMANAIIAETAAAHRATPAEVMGRNLSRRVVAARYACIRAIDAAFDWTPSHLGRLFGRDHSTVLYALGKLKKKPTV